jgi:SAM-dependent methyltransferase
MLDLLVLGLSLRAVSFAVGADAYDRFMGRYSALLAPAFGEFAAVVDGQRVLDVGCGTGALTGELVKRLGPTAVAAIDPSDAFVAAVHARYPAVDVRRASAEHLPFADRVLDATLAQLVVHFMDDPVAGLREMARVTREEGVVAACVWDHADGTGPLGLFWNAAHELDRDCEGESHLAGTRRGHLAELFGAARLRMIEETALSITVEHATFEAWWEPFTLGVGPAGSYVAGLDATRRFQLREQCRTMLPTTPFTVTARAWAARGLA